MPTLWQSDSTPKLLLAVQTNGENETILNKLSSELIPELQNILKFSSPETNEQFVNYIKDFDRNLVTLEAREKAVLAEQQKAETSAIKEEKIKEKKLVSKNLRLICRKEQILKLLKCMVKQLLLIISFMKRLK